MSNKYFYSIDDMESLRLLAQYYKLDAEALYALPLTYLCKVCNGAGAERWSDVKRKALTYALRRYEPAFAQHDVDYAMQVPKQIADKRLLNNMKKIWAKDFGFFRWIKPSARVERLVIIPAVFAAVALAGDSAFEAAKEQNVL